MSKPPVHSLNPDYEYVFDAFEQLTGEGCLLMDPVRCNQVFAKSQELYDKSDVIGSYFLAVCYNEGIGVSRDGKRASKLFEEFRDKQRSIDSPSPELLHCLGSYFCISEGEKKDALGFFLWAFKEGYFRSGYGAAVCYLNGIGVGRDEGKAFSLLKETAEKDHVGAQYYLALCYLRGVGTDQDEGRAFSLFKDAAEKGHVEAQHDLALCYLRGVGTGRDEGRAFSLFKDAAGKGHKESILELSNLYKIGVGDFVPKDEIEAIRWLQLAGDLSVNRNV